MKFFYSISHIYISFQFISGYSWWSTIKMSWKNGYRYSVCFG